MATSADLTAFDGRHRRRPRPRAATPDAEGHLTARPARDPRGTRGRTALVLGAGGTVGQAFHLAALTVLQQQCGWTAEDADLIVGTSAGAVVGACLRAGMSLEELTAVTCGGHPGSAFGPAGPPPDPPELRWRLIGLPLVRPLRHTHTLLRRSGPDHTWTSVVFDLLPRGRAELDAHAAWIDRATSGRWPQDELWICTVERRRLRRVVWGRRPRPQVTVGEAVAASCAVPGAVRPARCGDREYLDGGIHSPTNADLLREAGVDRAIVLSPMSSPPGERPLRWDRPARVLWHRRLRREVDQLRGQGIEVIVLEPWRREVRAMNATLLRDTAPARTIAELSSSLRQRVADAGRWHAHERAATGS